MNYKCDRLGKLSFFNCVKRFGRRAFKLILAILLLGVSGLLVIDAMTSYMVRDKIYTDIDRLPHREYALVLGTAKFYSRDVINQYYKYRLEAAYQLIEKGKVDKLLLSGDNKTPYYNEPKTMTNDLLKMGVNATKIRQDYAGYTTFDSTIRAKQVYQLPHFTIVSQKFHCERALFIAKFRNIDAICYAATYPEGAYQVRVREILARSAMVFSLLIGKEPESLEDIRSK